MPWCDWVLSSDLRTQVMTKGTWSVLYWRVFRAAGRFWWGPAPRPTRWTPPRPPPRQGHEPGRPPRPARLRPNCRRKAQSPGWRPARPTPPRHELGVRTGDSGKFPVSYAAAWKLVRLRPTEKFFLGSAGELRVKVALAWAREPHRCAAPRRAPAFRKPASLTEILAQIPPMIIIFPRRIASLCAARRRGWSTKPRALCCARNFTLWLFSRHVYSCTPPYVSSKFQGPYVFKRPIEFTVEHIF